MQKEQDTLTVRLDDIKLGQTDCALVFKDDGTLEVLSPMSMDKESLNYKLLESCIAHIHRLVAENNLPDHKNTTFH
jgi:hypothetical protein